MDRLIVRSRYTYGKGKEVAREERRKMAKKMAKLAEAVAGCTSLGLPISDIILFVFLILLLL